MAGPTPRDLHTYNDYYEDGLVRDKQMNTPAWPKSQFYTPPWPPTDLSVADLHRALERSREYQSNSWYKDLKSPTGFSQKLDPAQVPFLLDVREEDEYRLAKIPDATLIPLSQLQKRVQEIPRDRCCI